MLKTLEDVFGWTKVTPEIRDKAEDELKSIIDILKNVDDIYLCGGGYSDVYIHMSESKTATIEGRDRGTNVGKFVNTQISNSPQVVICTYYQFTIIKRYGRKIALITDRSIKIVLSEHDDQMEKWESIMLEYIYDQLKMQGYCGSLRRFAEYIFKEKSHLLTIFVDGYGIRYMKNSQKFFMREFRQFMSMSELGK